MALQTVLESVEISEGKTTLETVLNAIETVETAVKLTMVEAPGSWLKSGAKTRTRTAMRAAAAMLCVDAGGRNRRADQRQHACAKKCESSVHGIILLLSGR